jgi:hypothetical protein
MTPKKHIWQDKSVNEIDDYILSSIDMKQNKAKPYQVCFWSTGDFVNKDKNRIKRDTFISGNDSVDQQSQLISYYICYQLVITMSSALTVL